MIADINSFIEEIRGQILPPETVTDRTMKSGDEEIGIELHWRDGCRPVEREWHYVRCYTFEEMNSIYDMQILVDEFLGEVGIRRAKR